MKKQGIFLTILAVIVSCCFISNASITNASWGDDGDGAVICSVYTWQPIGETDGELTMYGDQFWGPGHMLGDIYASSSGDPTLTLNTSIDNDTSFTWTSYIVNVSMTVPFAISGQVANIPGDWSAAITQLPTLVGSEYVGQITYSAGTPVGIGNTLDFTYKLTFTGSTQYKFCQEMIPVPEPTSFALVGLSLASLIVVRRRNV